MRTHSSPSGLATRRILAVAAGLAAGLATVMLPNVLHTTSVTEWIRADFAYDVSDPALVAGDATVVAVVSIESVVRLDGDRTVFRARALDLLEGWAPEQVLISQLGYDDGHARHELEGFPLMRVGHSYVVAMVAPSKAEPADALLVLSAVGDGNVVPVDGVDDERADPYRAAVANQRNPWAQADGMENLRQAEYERWSRRARQ